MDGDGQGGVLETVLLGALVDSSLAGVALLDERLRVLRANARMAALGEQRADALRGVALAALAPGLAPALEPRLRHMLEDDAPFVETIELATAGLATRRLEVHCQLVRTTGGARGFLLQVEDTTERWATERRLKKSEAILAESQELAALGSWEWDLSSDKLRWSDELCRLAGIEPGHGPTDSWDWVEHLPERDRPWVKEIIRRCLATGEPFQSEHTLIGGGEERIIEARGRAEREGGRVVRLSGTVLDITERKRAEQRLKEQQQFLDAIVENIPNMIFVKEAKELRFVRFNRAGEELLGYRREELLGKTDYDFFPASEADKFIAQDRAVLATRRALEIPEESIHARKKGIRVLQSKKVPILDERGQPAYLLGISEDITERRRVEAFRLSDLLVRSMEDYAIFLLDTEGRVKTWNAGAERVTGYTADEIIGKPIRTLRDGLDDDSDRTHLAAAAALGHVVEEGPWRCKDGRQIWRVTTVTAIRDDAGNPIFYGTVTRDITERKRAEDERERLFKRLREALRLRDEFLSVASHELRTPVTTLMLQTELLRQLLAGPETELVARLPPLVDRLKRQTDRLEEHVARLLDVSRLSSGRVQLQLSDEDLGKIAEDVVARLREEQRGRPMIHFRAEPDLYGRWDTLRIDQVLTNLLSNAVKYGGGLPIEVVVANEGHEATLRVTDKGIGIAVGDQARIFDQFERAVSERHYGGLGLGLFIVRQLVEAMGGRVEVQSQPGAGASFVVRLPYGRRGEDPSYR